MSGTHDAPPAEVSPASTQGPRGWRPVYALVIHAVEGGVAGERLKKEEAGHRRHRADEGEGDGEYQQARVPLGDDQ